MIDVRPFARLGAFRNDWLDTRHHFSFASYHDPARMGFGRLRVWNDDEIAAGTGFDPHPHREMEIVTYVREGAITHRDSLGNEGRTEAGDVQVMHAGTGIVHAEYNLEHGADAPVPDLDPARPARRGAGLGRAAVPQDRRRPGGAGERPGSRRRRATRCRCMPTRRCGRARWPRARPCGCRWSRAAASTWCRRAAAVTVNGVAVGTRDGAAITRRDGTGDHRDRGRRAGAGRCRGWVIGALFRTANCRCAAGLVSKRFDWRTQRSARCPVSATRKHRLGGR